MRSTITAERALVLTLKLLSSPLGLGLDTPPPATIHVMGRPLYTWTPDLEAIIEVCPTQMSCVFTQIKVKYPAQL